ncbi:uncharacterized protein LOC126653632 [Mercurialis annua]|uniref:uncharacterized protein LOC126653632 n=1 Tax=Mercurialis annua TaxID=3986 RepID=UPI00216015C2|nr:uncharacterized protein LOC126653632 [Mercurialis annua]
MAEIRITYDTILSLILGHLGLPQHFYKITQHPHSKIFKATLYYSYNDSTIGKIEGETVGFSLEDDDYAREVAAQHAIESLKCHYGFNIFDYNRPKLDEARQLTGTMNSTMNNKNSQISG